MTMAYYPGNYYHYYSRDLFDPYSADSYYHDDDYYPAPAPLPSLPPEHSSPRSSPSKSKSKSPSPRPLQAITTPAAAPPTARPSSSYLALASEPSKTLPEPTRKLLILDLNGTLLLRSPRPAKSSRSQYQSHAVTRRVMPRPYLTALRAYLFAPQTRAWLDVMVWSSAQPHSVEDMVSRALGDDREWLVAIWARDTLGLTDDHYYRKVPTIKDLEKPWAALAPRAQRPADSKRKPTSSSSSPKWTGHSAATTLLLDDSHAKAALQPHNHLCVPEYTRTQRNADLTALELERAIQQQQQQQQDQEQQYSPSISHHEGGGSRTTRDDNDTIDASAHERAVSSPDSATSEVEQGHKRKRKKKKKDKAQARALQLQQQLATIAATANGTSPATPAPAPASAPAAVFDETLLAVIGVLHAARLQSSIAAWVRAGALLSPSPPPPFSKERAGDAESATVTWCYDPVLVRKWARRGREAMRELGLKVEHGIEH